MNKLNKKWPNDNLITLACVASYIAIAWGKLYPLGHNSISVLVLTSCFKYIEHDSIPICWATTWYQFLFLPVTCYSIVLTCYSIDSTLLGSALFTAPSCFCLAYHIVLTIYSQLDAVYNKLISQWSHTSKDFTTNTINLVIALSITYCTVRCESQGFCWC